MTHPASELRRLPEGRFTLAPFPPEAVDFATREDLLRYSVAAAPPAGMLMEFGVFEGASIRLIAGQASQRRVYGFDSFCGLPEKWRDGFEAGCFRTGIPSTPPNVELIVGPFSETLLGFLQGMGRSDVVSFIHMDCDLYSSTILVLRVCDPWIRCGAVILFDEYFGYPEWEEHEHRAFMQYCEECSRSFEVIGLVSSGQQMAARMTNEAACPAAAG